MPLDKQVLTILYDLILYVNKELCPPPPPPPPGGQQVNLFIFSLFIFCLPAQRSVMYEDDTSTPLL